MADVHFHPTAPWQIALARLDGALPFLSPELAGILAMRSLRRLWQIHVRDYPFDNIGLEHNPGLEAAELMRSWYAKERQDFLSWVSRRGPPALAHIATIALAAKGKAESFSNDYDDADRALTRLDDMLPSSDPLATLGEWVAQLRTDEIAFLESGTEIHELHGVTFARSAPKGAAWAASLAIAMRPQLFGLGAAPLALAGLAPRKMFRAEPEDPIPVILREAITTAVANLNTNLDVVRLSLGLANEALSELYVSSRAPDAWCLLFGLGPLTRAELARALGVTKRTASQCAQVLAMAGLATLQSGDSALRCIDEQKWSIR
jgi:hypothetical protein